MTDMTGMPRCSLVFRSLMQLESMYQEIILDHYRQPLTRACGSRSTPRCTT